MSSNRLTQARSAYLRSARHQPVDWHEWSPEAFARAAAEDKPILLDIGAVWCHWCHVMDRESYEDADTAHLINHHFIAIKVDRDERPDIDTRYQAAVAAISGQGGWPLTAFLTPQGQPFFGGTYFPPVDGHGRPSLRRVVATMAEAFYDRRDEVEESAGSVMAAIEQNESFDGAARDPGADLVERIIASALQQFDPRYGGFGSQPKFPHSAALDLLLYAAGRGNGEVRRAALVSLEKMSKGGIYDHLAGGFHRYSVDERWVVPHFEKMSYDNSELLRNYVHAYQTTGEGECARIARECLQWISECMSDRERGGFYASQDADFSLDDDGDYFTWTRAEAAAALTAEELRVVEPFFDIGPIGDMHHNHEKNVLHIEQPLAAAARAAGVDLERAAALIAQSKPKLYAARQTRPAPFIDRTIYTAWNSMMVTAHLEAGRVLALPEVTAFALRSLDRTLDAFDGATLGHVVAYGEADGAGQPVAGILDDYVFTGNAALDAWESTGEFRYYSAALALAELTLEKFYDEEKGGFFDTENAAEPQLGALGARRKPLQDAPSPAGNSVAATLLLRLAELAGRAEFRQKAHATLECFAGVVEHFGLYAASYGIALRRLVEPPVQIVILGDDALADSLERAALQPYAIHKSVVRLRKAQAQRPPSLAFLPPGEGSQALLCSCFTCQPPVFTPEALAAALKESRA